MYEAIARNRRRSFLLVLVLSLMLAVCGFILFEALAPDTGVVGALGAFLLAGLMGVFSWLAGGRALMAFAGARRIEPGDHPRLHNVVEEMAIAAGLPLPRVYLIDDPAPNAFATGRSPRDASVAVTRGLLGRLNRDELQGVIAHEMAHILIRDILFMTIAGVMVGAIVVIAGICEAVARSSGRRSSRRDRDRGGGGAIAIVLILLLVALLARPIARLLYLAASRQREYLADATGALLTRLPSGLASALEKIAASPARFAPSEPIAAMCIVNTLQDESKAVGFLGGAFSTHPPTSSRVAILRAMAGEPSYASYEAAYESVLEGRTLLPRRPQAAPSAAPLAAATAARLGTAGRGTGAGPDGSAEDAAAREASYRDASDLLRRRAGYRSVTCLCGARIDLPPGRAMARCPRCHREVTLPAA